MFYYFEVYSFWKCFRFSKFNNIVWFAISYVNSIHCISYNGDETEAIAGKIAMFCASAIGFIMVILYTVVTIQQVLFGFDSIVAGMENIFYLFAKVGITIGSLALGIVIFLIMLKAWKIKRGLND